MSAEDVDLTGNILHLADHGTSFVPTLRNLMLDAASPIATDFAGCAFVHIVGGFRARMF